ncbi:MAG: hypothetical protein HBSAPP02_12760 [Phycisphaerae bacterium]|nr:MAG: hypothetical protein HRU71_08445 [Planctomycetia bacterium]RIK70565.1 MAG: hypothetical protein DCC66_04610 [Planctomycetota bacterium]GJQ26244.1 MAG: hypothetical protein HBSAPP02_12760 [Phycisphaerae bacterium]
MPFRDAVRIFTYCLRLRCPRCGSGAIFEDPHEALDPNETTDATAARDSNNVPNAPVWTNAPQAPRAHDANNLPSSSSGAPRRRPRLLAWHHPVREYCLACDLPLRRREPDTWLFMYVSMALITGLYLIAMLWVFPAPSRPWLGRSLIAASALCLYLVTAPVRKALSLGLDYWVERMWKEP